MTDKRNKNQQTFEQLIGTEYRAVLHYRIIHIREGRWQKTLNVLYSIYSWIKFKLLFAFGPFRGEFNRKEIEIFNRIELDVCVCSSCNKCWIFGKNYLHSQTTSNSYSLQEKKRKAKKYIRIQMMKWIHWEWIFMFRMKIDLFCTTRFSP